MSGNSLPWRAILWIERFLPTPPAPTAEPSPAAKRRAALAAPFTLLMVTVPMVVGRRHELSAAVRQNHVALEQVMLVLAVCIAAAALAFGARACLDAKEVR